MQTLLEVLRKTITFFEGKGVEHPKHDAEQLFAHVLGCKRLDLYLQHERPLSDEQLAALRPVVARRGKREPLQHILGDTVFHGLTLKVDRRALIPRHETEELVEHLIATLGQHPPGRVLDLGTGTGALALALAHHWPAAEVWAVDQSETALSLARENADALNLSARVSFRQGNWLEAMDRTFDLIVCNPPYLTQAEWETAAPEVRDHEPREALVAEDDGLADLTLLVQNSRQHLTDGGLLALETGIAHHARLAEQAEAAGYTRHASLRDLQHRDRFFFAWR
jgi:release factor glutamine methyltransferase